MESIQQLMQRYEIQPKRGYGQNFLVNHGVIDKIVAAVAPTAASHIIEIGSGIGVLTRIIAKTGAHIDAVELDPVLVHLLEQELKPYTHVTVHRQDILTFRPPSLTPGQRYVVVGNIPYNISSPILEWLCGHSAQIERAVITMQREVAQRVAAAPGSKTYGALSIGVQAVAETNLLFTIRPGSFWPAPQVSSATLELAFPRVPRYPIHDHGQFRTIVNQAFQQRRKMLRNIYPAEVLQRAKIDPTRRPETLSVAEFIEITQLMGTSKNRPDARRAGNPQMRRTCRTSQ